MDADNVPLNKHPAAQLLVVDNCLVTSQLYLYRLALHQAIRARDSSAAGPRVVFVSLTLE